MAVVESGAPVLATTGTAAQIVDTALFAAIATTSSTTTTAGSSQTITVASGAAMSNPMWLTVDSGAATETVLAAVSGTSVTAFFTNAHSGTYNVVANVNRQIIGIGDTQTKGNLLTIDVGGSLYSSSPIANAVIVGKSASATSAILCAARTSPPRKALIAYNSSATVNGYIAEGITASIAIGGYTYLVPPAGTLEVYTVYTGVYNYISDSADGSYINVTERY